MSEALIDDAAQRLYIASMISNPGLFARVNHLLKPSYFDPSLQKTVTFLKEYFQNQRSVAPAQIVEAATKTKIDPVPVLGKADAQYIAEQIAQFCQIRAVTEAVLRAPSHIEKGSLGQMVNEIKLASQIALHSDLGIDYFNDPIERLTASESAEILIPTYWDTVDEMIGGGVGRQELILFLANSGGGKSVAKLNLGYNWLKAGLNGVYITLEMRDRVVAKRLDSIISRISGKNIFANKLKVGQDIEIARDSGFGRFFIKRMRETTTTADHITAYLRELEVECAFRPDFVIVDYLDLMATVQKHNGDSLFVKDKFVAEEVRAIGFDFDCIMVSSSQLGRCLDKNTKVELQTGEQVTLEALQIGQHILSNNGYVEVLAKTPVELKKCYKITLEDGSSVVMSADHKMPVCDSEGNLIGEKTIKSGLKVGDLLCSNNFTEVLYIEHYPSICLIEEVGEVEVIDIEVSGNNLFYANGILTHNSAITATREQKSLGQDMIQGGISKINTADLAIALVKDEAMDAAGLYRFEFLKSRNSSAVNKKLDMAWNPESLRISDMKTSLKLERPKMQAKPGLSAVKPGSNSDSLEMLINQG